MRNGPSFSIGQIRSRTTVNPDTKEGIPSNLITPSPTKYVPPQDNIYFKKNKIAHSNEKKFFEPTNMPKIRA